jgi:hypothetical protein
LSFGIDFTTSVDVFPSALIGASPYVDWHAPESSNTPIALGVRAAFLHNASTSVAASGSASFVRTLGRLDGCGLSWPPGPAHILACARIEAGQLEATGANIAGASSSDRAWVAAGALVRGQWKILPPLFLEAEVAPMIHITADRFFFRPNQTVLHIPWVGLDASIGLGVLIF